MLVGQQVLGFTLYSTYSSYFSQLAGLSDPFLGTVISNTISLAALSTIVATVETAGRRSIACSALTLQRLANMSIGILSLLPVNDDRNRALVAIASFLSTSHPHPFLGADIRYRISRYRIDWVGLCGRNLVSEVTSPYFRICGGYVCRFWGHYQHRRSVPDQRGRSLFRSQDG